MNKDTNNSLKHIGLQFFAEGSEEGTASQTTQTTENSNNTAEAETKETGSETKEATKSYTQEQLNSMMAREKRTARQAILKELGVDAKDEKGFTAAIAEIKKTLDAGKTQQQLDAEAKKNAEDKLAESEAKNARLELKVAALAAGAKAEALDDVITLAVSKISDSEPAEKVLKDLKTKYPTLFGESGSAGTGNSNNPPRNKAGNSNLSLGKRLAQNNKTNTKSSYFKNN